MPIPKEMFDILGDYSGLENMHPYGDFLSLYSLPVHASIAEAADIFRDLRGLDDRILTLYVSYILLKVGYYVSDFSFPIEGISGQLCLRGTIPQGIFGCPEARALALSRRIV